MICRDKLINSKAIINIIDFEDMAISTKIDTGATEIMIPFEYRKRLTTYSEKNIKNFKEKTFTTTSGCNIIGYNANLHLKINIGDCNFPKTLSVYFYDSEIKNKDILFGLNPIKKHFKFCISRDEFSLQAI